jgi:anti-sigma B factor antagonist
MKVSTQDYNEVTVIELQGDLDADFTEPLKDAIIGVVARHRIGVVLDMSGVVFIDGEGLELLLWIRDYCKQNKTQLRLAGLDENCAKIIEVTRLDSEFEHYVELTEAVKSFV